MVWIEAPFSAARIRIAQSKNEPQPLYPWASNGGNGEAMLNRRCIDDE